MTKLYYDVAELQKMVEFVNSNALTGSSPANLKEMAMNVKEAFFNEEKNILKGVVYTYLQYSEEEFICVFSARLSPVEQESVRTIDITEEWDQRCKEDMEEFLDMIGQSGTNMIEALDNIEDALQSEVEIILDEEEGKDTPVEVKKVLH